MSEKDVRFDFFTRRNYADAVRCVKKKVDPQKLGVDIKNIRRTQNGDILLETKENRRSGETEGRNHQCKSMLHQSAE